MDSSYLHLPTCLDRQCVLLGRFGRPSRTSLARTCTDCVVIYITALASTGYFSLFNVLHLYLEHFTAW